MIVFKVIILGDAGSGKTCLMNNYLGKPFNEHDPPTIGVEFGSKIVTASEILKPESLDKYRKLIKILLFYKKECLNNYSLLL